MSDINRRQFLAVTATLAIAASLPTPSPAAVPASTTVEPLVNKYKETIRLFDRCVAVSNDPKECGARFAVVLKYMRENFELPPRRGKSGFKEVVELAKPLLSPGPKVDIAGIRGIPPSVADSIYPIAICKLGLVAYGLPFDPYHIGKEFQLFYDNYSGIIIGSLS